MIIKELQLLSEALWESVKSDLEFFSPIQVFVKKLSEVDFSERSNLDDIKMYAEKIEEFFNRYRPRQNSDTIYFPPPKASTNDTTVKRIYQLVEELWSLEESKKIKEFENAKPNPQKKSTGMGHVFIGHGRSKLWARVQIFLNDDLSIKTLTFEDESRTSETILNVLSEFLEKSSFAILVMTAEDETSDGKYRARQNLIHEAGLFQGRLGFDKVIILKQDGVEEFSNVAGLQYIPFSSDNIEQCFYELQRKFKKLGLVK